MRAVVPFLRDRLGEASRLLRGPRAPKASAVHLARKRLKDARAALRLLRPVLGRALAEREDATLRRAARRLSALRDAQVAAGLLESLGGGGTLRPAAKPPRPVDWRLSSAQIAASRRRLDAAAPREPSASEVRAGVERNYRQARRRLRAALRSGSGEDRHSLRKSVKRLLAQRRLLSRASRPRDGFDRLARLLGEERDLALLLKALPRRGNQSPWETAAGDRAEGRRRRIAGRALALARELLAPRPRDFSRRLVRRK